MGHELTRISSLGTGGAEAIGQVMRNLLSYDVLRSIHPIHFSSI